MARGTRCCAREIPPIPIRCSSRAWVTAFWSPSSHGALLEAGGVPPDLDRLAIARWVVHGTVAPRRTFYARIERVPPGHVLTGAPEGVGLRRYWRPGQTSSDITLTGENAVERFGELLDQAVERCASVGPLGVFLSGGVDSAMVAASAAGVSRANAQPDPIALSLVYPHPEANEERTQRRVAEQLGVSHQVVPLLETVGEEGLLTAALHLARLHGCPA